MYYRRMRTKHLQIELPIELHEALGLIAKAERRSKASQASIILEREIRRESDELMRIGSGQTQISPDLLEQKR